MKKLEYSRGVAPSSSTKKNYNSETFQVTSKRMASQSTFMKAARSPDLPSDKEQISQKSKYRKRGIRGISPENDLDDKSGAVKNEAMDFVTEANLEHSTQKKYVSHACPHCQYKTPNTSHLKCHIDAIHGGKRPYQCQMCDYSASQVSNLKTHVHSVHEGMRRYKCKQCDYRASQATTIRKHVDAVHERKKPYICEHCDYRASEASNLRRHVDAVHEGKRPHMCPHCDYRATRIGTLRRHVRAVHERMKPYGCRICDYRTAENTDLRKHTRAVHGGKENIQMSKE